VVLGVSATGLSYVRSLHRHGVPTLLLTERGWIGRPSRYELTVGLPRIDDEPDIWLQALVATAERLGRRPILLVAFDQAVLFVGRHSGQLGPLYDFLVPPLAIASAIVDKRQQYELAAAAGIPIPRTLFPGDAVEAVEMAEDIGYPCLVKPQVGSAGGRQLGGKAAVAEDPSSLRAWFDRLAAGAVPGMVQEIVPGGDDALFGYLSFWGSEGELAWITKQKLRQNPTLYGDGTFQRTVDVPRVAGLSRQFLKALDYVGVGSIEFKHDARDGSFRLIELNARAVSGNQLAVVAGVDLPYISYAYHVYGGAPTWEQQWDVHWIHELYDLRTLLRSRRGFAGAMREWIRSLRQADAFALGSWGDPAPLLGAFGHAAVRTRGRALGLRRRRGSGEDLSRAEVPEPRVAD
jgi:D-aspartate ligase